ncbi:MAG: M42 family peptidase, partial [Candidatus Diapherotrites archaeon]|nr:M42 family peptidase [Candidatus Diapherotrites archaeon]
MEAAKLFEELCNIPGVSTNEENVAKLLKKELSKIMSSIQIDKMGNLIGKSIKNPEILLVAHMDEVGLIVKNITETGFIEFEKLGGILDQYLLGQKVLIHGKKDIIGVIQWKMDSDLTREKLKERVLKNSDLYIDTGLDKKELIALEIFPGTIVSFNQQITCSGGTFFGKAFDDRAGCFVALQVVKKLSKNKNIGVLFTTQEEVGLKGAQTAIQFLSPKLVIEIEITSTSDTPNLYGKPIPISIGKGPVVTIADGADGLTRGYIMLPWLIKKLRQIRNPESVQWRISVGGTSDASIIQLAKGCIPTISIAVPMRYHHSAIGLL